MKSFSFFNLFIFLVFSTLKSQINWTWVNGSSTVTTMAPVYGTQGVAAPANTPGNRENATTWTDSNGNFWLYGGYNSTFVFMGDLWKYDPSTNMWTWMKGSAGSGGNGVYGTQGVSAPGNRPGGREWAGGWADGSGNLWFYGGYGNSATASNKYMNDLWKYTISSNEWTWMKGSTAGYIVGVPGTQGVAAATNDPGSRYFFGTATDANGNFWLFGGVAFFPTGDKPLNDLWKYDVNTNNWTWINGTPTGSVVGTYGTIGVPGPANVPGSRTHPALLADNVNNCLFMFSGVSPGFSNGTNDLWKYDLSTGNWTWLKGSSGAVTPQSFGTMGLSAASNMPSARYRWGSSAYMLDGIGNIWIFGGITGITSYLNDVWRYKISTNEWTWMKGSNVGNQTGIYGTMGVAAASNNPGGRYAQAGWKDQMGKLWIYGGNGYNANSQGFLNDLWKLDVCDVPDPPANSTPITSKNICTGYNAQLLAFSASGAVSWYATTTSTFVVNIGNNFSTPVLFAAGNPSIYTWYVAATMGCGASYSRTAVNVTVNPQPVINVALLTPSICAGETAAINFAGITSFTCQAQTVNYVSQGGTLSILPPVTETYTLIAENAQGCKDTAAFMMFVDQCTGISEQEQPPEYRVYPNPHTKEFFIQSAKANSDDYYEIVNLMGQLVMRNKIFTTTQEVKTTELRKGIYYLKIIRDNEKVEVISILKTD